MSYAIGEADPHIVAGEADPYVSVVEEDGLLAAVRRLLGRRRPS